MPTNKNALLRYQILDRCFSDFNKKYEIDDLLQKVNETLYDLYGTEVSVRQIRDDIKCLRDRMTYNAPIKAYQYAGKKCYYRYEDRSYSIFNNELSTEEVTQLRSTIDMLARFRDGSKNAWLEEVISNLEYRFGVKGTGENIVSFEQNEQLKGLEFLSELIDSAVNHKPLQVVYRTYKGKEKTSIVHPYHLKQYNNRWFLFGLEENKEHGNHITNMALDRIVTFCHVSDVVFIPNKDIDFTMMFKDVVGVTIPGEYPLAEEVFLRFDSARFPYIVSKPIHPSQQILNEDEFTISLKVRPNKELEAIILSYGNQVEILKPEWLRMQIADNISENYRKYFPMQNSCTESM